jgi:hypothetical protein
MFSRTRIRALAVVGAITLAAFAFLVTPSVLEKSGQAQSEQLGTTTCTPLNVAVFVGSRIHIRCTEVQEGSLQFYALSTQDPDVDRVLSVLNSAVANGKKLFIFYNKMASASPAGCLELDCRKIETVVMLP